MCRRNIDKKKKKITKSYVEGALKQSVDSDRGREKSLKMW